MIGALGRAFNLDLRGEDWSEVLEWWAELSALTNPTQTEETPT